MILRRSPPKVPAPDKSFGTTTLASGLPGGPGYAMRTEISPNHAVDSSSFSSNPSYGGEGGGESASAKASVSVPGLSGSQPPSRRRAVTAVSAVAAATVANVASVASTGQPGDGGESVEVDPSSPEVVRGWAIREPRMSSRHTRSNTVLESRSAFNSYIWCRPSAWTPRNHSHGAADRET